ncbi:MAG: adenylate/guanylate cyclase domain-containing protein [Acidobacteriota bacterium]
MRVALGLGVAASLLVLGLELSRVLDPVEAVVTDLQMRLRGPQPADERVAIVAIDSESIDLFGRWPWPRTCIAALIDRLSEAGASVVAMDIVFSEPTRSPPGVDLSAEDDALAHAFERSGNVVLGYFFRRQPAPAASGSAPFSNPAPLACYAPSAEPTSGNPLAGWSFQRVLGEGFPVPDRPRVEPNLPDFVEAAAAQGFFSHERREGVQRHYELVNAHAGGYYPALALAAVARYLDSDLELRRRPGGLPEIRIGARRVRADEAGRLWINYRGGAGTVATHSAAGVLAGTIEPAMLAGKLIFLGATETGIGDVAATPFGAEMPGVEVHATAADNLLNGSYLQDTAVQYGLSLAALLLIGPLVAWLIARSDHYFVASLLAILLVLAWPVACHLTFRIAGWHLQVVPPVLAGGIALVGVLRFQVGAVERRARHIRRTFQRYVSAAVVEEMLADPDQEPKLGGESRELTVLFSDIRGFTTLAEGLDSEEVVRVLNEFFTPMTRLVLDTGGTLDKYMGDALMAFFGAPVAQADHARRACTAALTMAEELDRLNGRWIAEGRLPEDSEVGIGIGVNSGEMSVGNMGSDDVFDYTVIGDNVNLGSRIEGLNKYYRTEILVSGETARQAGDDAFLFREIDRVQVKGKHQPVSLWELLAKRPSAPAAEERAQRFEEALAAYREKRFADGEALFNELVAAYPEDGPAAVFLERCRAYRENPPPDDWDAVEVLTQK